MTPSESARTLGSASSSPSRANPASVADIRALLETLPGPHEEAAAAADAREAVLTKPPGALGRLEELSRWLASWQGRHPPRLERALVCVFAGNHGVAAQGVSAYPADVTAQMVENFRAGGAAINQLCRAMGAAFRIFDIELDRPTADFTSGPAMSEDEFVQAFTLGMGAIDPDADILCLGEMGIANTTAAAAICHGLFGGTGADWAGPGTGVAGEELARKARVVESGVRANADTISDPLHVLRAVGGRELAAIAGAVVAARMARVPVLLDGYVCTAAAAALASAVPGALDHCRVAHVSAEPGHRLLLRRLGAEPLLDLGMRLGEGSGAALAISLLKAAVACHTGMASFAEAGVSEKSDSN